MDFKLLSRNQFSKITIKIFIFSNLISIQEQTNTQAIIDHQSKLIYISSSVKIIIVMMDNARKRMLTPISRISQVEIEINGKHYIDFGTNNYLGLAEHPLLKQRSTEYLQRFGAGSMSSRLLSGNVDCFAAIEHKIASLKGTEDALIMGSGFQVNCSLLPALLDRKSLVILDKLSHRSLIQGAKLSGAKMLRFLHNDMEHLNQLLKNNASKYSRIIIVTESVFSIDGDICPLNQIQTLAKKYNALIYLDEAHATGILGEKGMGLGSNKIDIIMGTFSKAAGSYGAYVACNHQIKDLLTQKCTGLIYSTALPPAILGAIDAALDLIPHMEKERLYLKNISAKVRKKLNMPYNETPIIPIIAGDDLSALKRYHYFLEKGLYIPPIRPPSVPEGKSKLRLSLSAAHTEAHLEKLLNAL